VAIETRANGKQYFYRSRRIDGRVVREYVASGPEATVAAEADRQERQQREAAQAAERRELDLINAALEPLAAFEHVFEITLEAALSASGFHKHKGQWRLKHGNGCHKSNGVDAGAVA
jgi:hypothetical protein